MKQIHYIRAYYFADFAVYCEESEIDKVFIKNDSRVVNEALTFDWTDYLESEDIKHYDKDTIPLTMDGDISKTVAEIEALEKLK